MKRRNKAANSGPDADTKQQYRCSLINLENSQDEELDAILGELSVLESQFDDELVGKNRDENGKEYVQWTRENE